MSTAPYRQPADSSPAIADALAARGRQLRGDAAQDPHALRAPTQVSGPRATALEEMSARFEDTALPAIARRPRVAGQLFMLLAVVLAVPLIVFSVGVGYVANRVFHTIFAVPLIVALLFGGTGYAIARYRGRHRRWLAAIPLRVDGFLEIIGREVRVERLLVKARFRDGAPDVEYIKDVLTGAGLVTEGVALLPDGAVGIHSPNLAGSSALVHDWIRGVVGTVLVALDEVRPVRLVELVER